MHFLTFIDERRSLKNFIKIFQKIEQSKLFLTMVFKNYCSKTFFLQAFAFLCVDVYLCKIYKLQKSFPDMDMWFPARAPVRQWNSSESNYGTDIYFFCIKSYSLNCSRLNMNEFFVVCINISQNKEIPCL